MKFNFFSKEKSTEDWCEYLNIENYTIRYDGIVDVNSDLYLRERLISHLPIKFGIINGNFNCSSNVLKTLEGCPETVIGDFTCSNNKLTSLEFGPKEVKGNYSCLYNKLTTLKGCPKVINGKFNCNANKLTTLEDGPIEVLGGIYYCEQNYINSNEGFPSPIRYMYIYGNPIWEIYRHFPTYESYIDSLDYNYLRGDKIVKHRFQEALEEINVMEAPEFILGYKYI